MSGGPRVLLIATNGMGLGHLTRAAAISRRLRDLDAVPVLLSLSPLIAPLRDLGLVVEHLPSYAVSPLERWHWQHLLADHLEHLASAYEVSAVVFDGVAPYRGVRTALARDGAPPYVWVRRGQRRQDVGPPPPAEGFALVIEPGEVDRGALGGAPTSMAAVGRGGVPVVSVEPILLHDHRDLLDPEAARRVLGLPPDGRFGLISLGTGADGELSARGREAVRVLGATGITPIVARSPLLPPAQVEGAVVVRRYPLAPLHRAFDVAVVAAGYNSVAEVLACRTPAVLVPNPEAQVDDQAARALAAADLGLAACWQAQDLGDLVRSVLTDDGLSDRLAGRPLPRGAQQAAEAVLGVARTWASGGRP